MSRQVAIVGAGIVGLSCAYSLREAGYEVTVLDRELDAEGCSYGNGGIIVPSHFTPIASPGMVRAGLRMMLDRKSPFGLAGIPDLSTLAWIGRFLRSATKAQVAKAAPLVAALNLASRDLYRALVDRLGCEVGLASRGLLMVCNTAHGLEEESEAAQEANRLGLRTTTLDRTELDSLEPDVSFADGVKGAVHFLDDAHLTPATFMRCFRSQLADTGVKFVLAPSVALDASGESVRIEGVPADQIVVAAGVWSGDLVRPLGMSLPMLSGKGYGFTVPYSKSMTTPAILVESRIAVTPMLDGVRFVGTLELGHPNARINHNRIAGVSESIPRYYRGFNLATLSSDKPWFGHRPCTPDGLPYIGRSRRFKNLTIAAGHAMMGMSLGPVTGKLVAEVVQDLPPSFNLELLSPNRYD